MLRGLVIGKFYPFHNGHSELIDFAQSKCDQLTVLVVESKHQWIPVDIRRQWIQETHPKAIVKIIPDIYDDDNSLAWAEHTVKFLGYVPNTVFTSEDYGNPYAQYMGCEHQRYVYRTDWGISGTKIRNDPYEHWDDLPKAVKPYFVLRVTIVGAESTGKTTLAKKLATRYNTVWTPEYGRMYSEGLYTLADRDVWTTDDFVNICEGQNILESSMIDRANRLMICDTDAFATGIWHERYMKYRSKEVEDENLGLSDYYLVPEPDVEFVQDGIRDGEHLRQWMHDLFIQRLEEKGYPYKILTGSYEHREAQAVGVCHTLLTHFG